MNGGQVGMGTRGWWEIAGEDPASCVFISETRAAGAATGNQHSRVKPGIFPFPPVGDACRCLQGKLTGREESRPKGPYVSVSVQAQGGASQLQTVAVPLEEKGRVGDRERCEPVRWQEM